MTTGVTVATTETVLRVMAPTRLVSKGLLSMTLSFQGYIREGNAISFDLVSNENKVMAACQISRRLTAQDEVKSFPSSASHESWGLNPRHNPPLGVQLGDPSDDHAE